MKCHEVQKQLSEYLDNVLPSDITKQIENHIHACPLCSSELSSIKKNIHELNNLPKLNADRNFLKEVREKIEERKKTNKTIPFFRFRRMDLLRVAALLLICLGVVKMTGVLDQDRQPSTKAQKEKSIVRVAKKAARPQKTEAIMIAKISEPEKAIETKSLPADFAMDTEMAEIPTAAVEEQAAATGKWGLMAPMQSIADTEKSEVLFPAKQDTLALDPQEEIAQIQILSAQKPVMHEQPTPTIERSRMIAQRTSKAQSSDTTFSEASIDGGFGEIAASITSDKDSYGTTAEKTQVAPEGTYSYEGVEAMSLIEPEMAQEAFAFHEDVQTRPASIPHKAQISSVHQVIQAIEEEVLNTHGEILQRIQDKKGTGVLTLKIKIKKNNLIKLQENLKTKGPDPQYYTIEELPEEMGNYVLVLIHIKNQDT